MDLQYLLDTERISDLIGLIPELEYFISNNNNNNNNLRGTNEACLIAYKKCSPYIASKSSKLNLSNQMLFDLKHCYCDLTFYNCLKRADSMTASRLGHIYFNTLNMKCFQYKYQQECQLYVLGACVYRGRFKCYAKIRDNPRF